MPFGEFLDLVIAVSAVAAVIVAVVLGCKAIDKATEALERSRLDYLGACADRVSQALTEVLIAHGAFRAHLQPFWKQPDDPDSNSVEHGPDDKTLLEAEVATHESVYRLEAARLTMVSALDSLRPFADLICRRDERDDNGSKRLAESKLDEVVAWGEVVCRSVFPNYLVLIPPDPFEKRTCRADARDLEATIWFLSTLDLDECVWKMTGDVVRAKVAELIEDQAIQWTSGGHGGAEPLDVLVAVHGDADSKVPVHMSSFTDAFTAWAVETLAGTTRELLTAAYQAAAARPSAKKRG